jgi:signal transduction histidine kinase
MAGDIKRRGLGLSTVFGIVKNHGGFITVESKKNVGTLFKVALPSLPPLDSQRFDSRNT